MIGGFDWGGSWCGKLQGKNNMLITCGINGVRLSHAVDVATCDIQWLRLIMKWLLTHYHVAPDAIYLMHGMLWLGVWIFLRVSWVTSMCIALENS